MNFRRTRRLLSGAICLALTTGTLLAQAAAQSPAPPSTKQGKSPASAPPSGIDPGVVTNGVYRNKTLTLTCRIPEAWVLRTDEMNARNDSAKEGEERKTDEADLAHSPTPPASSAGAKVLLAAFSRPPEAKGEEVNASLLIAAESASSYTGLTEAAQYFYPLTEVAKAQGFALEEDPYAVAIGTRTLVRGDFHKNMGSRVMHQSTLAMLAGGYVISITVIAGTDDEVEDLIDGVSFSAGGK
jgi:hypothetical protein